MVDLREVLGVRVHWFANYAFSREVSEGDVKGMLLNIEKNGAILGVIGEGGKPREFKAFSGMFKKQ